MTRYLHHACHANPAEAKQQITSILARSRTVDDAAEALGVSRRTLFRWLETLGIPSGLRPGRKPGSRNGAEP
jgi:predicted DNA-binding transcriptional regulator YafY